MGEEQTRENAFTGCGTVHELIGVAIGAGTSPRNWMSERTATDGDPNSFAEPMPATCDTLGRPCVFQDDRARAIVRDTEIRLEELIKKDLYAHLLKVLSGPAGSKSISEFAEAVVDSWEIR